MNSTTNQAGRTSVRLAGWSLILAAIGFMVVFSWLAARFGYPDVLDGKAGDVLPALLSLGTPGRAVWVLYALIPLLLVPASVGAAAAWREAAPNAMRATVILGVVTAISMLLGLARWPTIHWELATAYATAGADARVAMDAVFRGLNLYLGNFIGEFLGEIGLSGFFILTGFAMLKSGAAKWLGIAGYVVGVAGLIAALRNVTTLVAPVAELNNYLLPVWLITLGVVLVRWKK
jgi:hypothetical protein